MASLRDSIDSVGSDLHPADGVALMERSRQYVADGYPVAQAETMAIDYHRTDAQQKLDSVYQQVGVEKPKPPEPTFNPDNAEPNGGADKPEPVFHPENAVPVEAPFNPDNAVVNGAPEKDLKTQFSEATPFERLKMMFGSRGYGDTPVEGATPIIGSEAAGTKGGLLTIPKAEGTGTDAGIIDAANKLSAGLTSPENIALLVGTAGLGGVATLLGTVRAAVAAKIAQTATIGTFVALGAKDTVEAAKEAKATIADPESTDAQKADAVATTIFTAAMTTAAAHGTIEIAKGIKGRGAESDISPQDAARDEVNKKFEVASNVDAEKIPTFNPENAVPNAPVENPVADRVRYEEIDREMKDLIKKGTYNGPEFDKLAAENEQLKNRNSSNPGMPPEVLDENGKPTPPVDMGDSPLIEPPISSTPEQARVDEGFKTSLKRAVSDAERESYGFPPLDDVGKRSFEKARENTLKVVAENPEAPKELLADVAANPRAMNDTEIATVMYRKVQLENEFRAAQEKIASGVGERSAHEAEQTRILDEMHDLFNVAERAGSEAGVNLNALKMAVDENYDLASVSTKLRASKGERLSLEEIDRVTAEVEELNALKAEHENYKRRASELLMKPEGAPATVARRASLGSRILDTLEERKNAALERQKSKAGRVSSGLDPTDLKDFADIGAFHIARGLKEVSAWSVEMVNEVGERIRPFLQQIYDASKAIHDDLAKNEPRLKATKTRLENQSADLERRIATGDLSKPARRKTILDNEANILQAKVEKQKAVIQAMYEQARYDRLSGFQKAMENGLNTYDAARNIMATGEFSFLFRQGKLTILSHPILAAKAMPNMFKALLGSDTTARALDLQVMNHPEFPAAKTAGVHIVEAGAKLSKKEEIFASRVGEKIPGLRNFNQAGRVFLNKIRFDTFRALKDSFGATPEQQTILAQFVNESTGRGGLGKAEPAAVVLGRTFFSPRFWASRIQMAVGHSMWRGDFATRRVIAKEYAKILVGFGVYYSLLYAGLSSLTDKKVEVKGNATSTDFGKVKIGNTRLDPLAGLSQNIVMAARTTTGKSTDAKGKTTPIRGQVPFGKPKWSDIAARYARSKLHPIPGSIVNLFDGTDLAGNPATIGNQALNLVEPMTYVDIYQALQEQDLPEGVALSLLAMLGEGLQTYKPRGKRPKVIVDKSPAGVQDQSKADRDRDALNAQLRASQEKSAEVGPTRYGR